MPEDTTPHENQTDAEPHAQDAPAPAAAAKPALSPALVLGFTVIVLLVALVAVSQRLGSKKSAVAAAELAALQAQTAEVRSQLNRDRAALGKPPLEDGTETLEDISARFKKDADAIVAMAGSYQAMLAENATQLSARNEEILRSEQLRQSFASDNARLQGELQRARASGTEVDQLRGELATTKSQRDALTAELASVRADLAAKGKGVSADDFADLKRQLEETKRAKEFFEARLHEMEGQLTKTQAKLFASSENELLPAAVELFRSLRALENSPDSEISAAYSSLGEKLGASVLQTFSFATGSSALAPADQEKLRSLAVELPDGDLLLAIGYASETGNVDGNRTLSSSRATTVAEFYSSVKRKEQLVQAVYLGQTDRFSSRIPERNQIVEVWRIRKK